MAEWDSKLFDEILDIYNKQCSPAEWMSCENLSYWLNVGYRDINDKEVIRFLSSLEKLGLVKLYNPNNGIKRIIFFSPNTPEEIVKHRAKLRLSQDKLNESK